MHFPGTYAIYLPMHYLGFLRRAATLLCLGYYRLHSSFCTGLEYNNHNSCAICRSISIVVLHKCLLSLRNGPKADPNPCGAACSNGKRQIHRQFMGIGAILCQQYTAGLTTMRAGRRTRLYSSEHSRGRRTHHER